jgi:serine/threonine protein kinase
MAYCWQLASALGYLTTRSIIHRDIAARNVLVAKPSLVKVRLHLSQCAFSHITVPINAVVIHYAARS